MNACTVENARKLITISKQKAVYSRNWLILQEKCNNPSRKYMNVGNTVADDVWGRLAVG